jgi:hypothetical protein
MPRAYVSHGEPFDSFCGIPHTFGGVDVRKRGICFRSYRREELPVKRLGVSKTSRTFEPMRR